jgi:hypothetical protein
MQKERLQLGDVIKQDAIGHKVFCKKDIKLIFTQTDLIIELADGEEVYVNFETKMI